MLFEIGGGGAVEPQSMLFKKFLRVVPAEDIWINQNLEVIVKNRKSAVEKLKNHLVSMDIQNSNSKFNLYYRIVSSLELSQKY